MGAMSLLKVGAGEAVAASIKVGHNTAGQNKAKANCFIQHL
jgi:hypothetical protein